MSVDSLTASNIEQFEANGFVVPNYRLSPAKLSRLQGLAADLIDANPEFVHQPLSCPHIAGSGPQQLAATSGWLDYPTDPEILDMVCQLIGPNLILWGTTLFNKPAQTGRGIPWHRDGRYWPIEPLATTSVWIAITDSNIENGCLRCISGSHQQRTVGEHFRSTCDEDMIPETLKHGEYDASAACDIELEAGQMVIFDVYTAHGSNPNTSGRSRAGFAMRYMPSSSFYNHHNVPIADSPGAGHHLRALTLLRGIDERGRNDFKIGHPDLNAV